MYPKQNEDMALFLQVNKKEREIEREENSILKTEESSFCELLLQ